jgi:hypothetical protein
MFVAFAAVIIRRSVRIARAPGPQGAKRPSPRTSVGMDDSRTDSVPAVDALALAMMNSFGQLSLILGHMHRHQAEGRAAPEALDPPFALAEILKSVLRELADEHAVDDIATAAQMLASATMLIGDELFIVDLDRLDLT